MNVTRRKVLVSAGAGAVGLLALRTIATGAAGAPLTLEFWGGAVDDFRQDQLKVWAAEHPTRKVSFHAAAAVGTGVPAQRKMAAAVAAHKAPHVADVDRFQIATYVNWGMFRALDDHIRRDKYDLSLFASPVLEEAMGFDGKSYGLPSSVDNRLLYWNKDLFTKAGLDPDQPPTTWGQLRTMALQLTGRGGRGALERIGFHPAEGQATLHPFAWQNGGAFQSPDGKSATLPQASNQDALQWLVDLTRDLGGWGAVAGFRDTWKGGAQHPFLAGQLAMQYQVDGWAGDVVARYRPGLGFGVAPLPVRQAGDAPLTWSGGYSYVMSRESKNADAGWDLIKWLLSEPGWTAACEQASVKAQAQAGVFLPGMTGQPGLDRRLAARYQTGRPDLDAVPRQASALMEHSRFRELSIAAAELWDGTMRAQMAALSGTKSVRQTLEENNAIVQRALDQSWIFVPR
jgi:ABC-type glycerol-3-phosphate transport system substrate-binding protein